MIKVQQKTEEALKEVRKIYEMKKQQIEAQLLARRSRKKESKISSNSSLSDGSSLSTLSSTSSSLLDNNLEYLKP